MVVLYKRKIPKLDAETTALGIARAGKYTPQTPQLPDNDIRKASPDWLVYFRDGKATPEFVKKLDRIKEVLTEDGRTLVQGSLGWVWARSPVALPIPGFKTMKQVEENAKALECGPLKPNQLKAIDEIFGKRNFICE